MPTDVITWNIGPQGVDLSFPLIAQTLSKGAAVVMFQEVSFHPEERRRVKGILKKIGSDYWCVMESSQRVSAGREDCKAGASTKNFEAPWAYAVVTFLHKDVFKQPTHLDWAAQYSNKAMKHCFRGGCLAYGRLGTRKLPCLSSTSTKQGPQRWNYNNECG